MLVILMDDQILSPQQVCQSCLLADQRGQPRWQKGRLCCGQTTSQASQQLPTHYNCPMGFRLANIE